VFFSFLQREYGSFFGNARANGKERKRELKDLTPGKKLSAGGAIV